MSQLAYKYRKDAYNGMPDTTVSESNVSRKVYNDNLDILYVCEISKSMYKESQLQFYIRRYICEFKMYSPSCVLLYVMKNDNNQLQEKR